MSAAGKGPAARRRGAMALGLEFALAAALLLGAGLGAWRLNRPLPDPQDVLVTRVPEGAALVDARGSLSYRRGHLPSARHLFARDLLAFDAGIAGGLAAPEALAERVARLGLEPGERAVVYDEGDLRDAPLVALVLRAFGVDAAVLEGGLPAALATGLEASREPPPPAAALDPTALSFDDRLLVRADEARGHLEENLVAPLDAREAEAYLAAHVENAVNLSAELLLPASGAPRWSELHEQFRRARMTRETHPLIYGADAAQAARVWLAAAAYGVPHLHVYAAPFEGLVAAGLPVSETATLRAVSTPSSSVCWR